MFNVQKGECDWEDQVDCNGKEKLIGIKIIKINENINSLILFLNLDTNGLDDQSNPEVSSDGKGRVTKFCMLKENGNYADVYYCNVYHNCHGGFDTVQYCSNSFIRR